MGERGASGVRITTVLAWTRSIRASTFMLFRSSLISDRNAGSTASLKVILTTPSWATSIALSAGDTAVTDGGVLSTVVNVLVKVWTSGLLTRSVTPVVTYIV